MPRLRDFALQTWLDPGAVGRRGSLYSRATVLHGLRPVNPATRSAQESECLFFKHFWHLSTRTAFATKKTKPGFPWNTGCLIGILFHGLWNIPHFNWSVFHPKKLNNQGPFCHCSSDPLTIVDFLDFWSRCDNPFMGKAPLQNIYFWVLEGEQTETVLSTFCFFPVRKECYIFMYQFHFSVHSVTWK